jgi:uncharacterized membrane protein
MPFCTQCGSQVEPADVFCAQCGSRQGLHPATEEGEQAPPAASKRASNQDFLKGVSPRTASLISYIPFIGWIGAIVVLAADRFRQNREVRFHAFQGLYLYAAYFLGTFFLGEFMDFEGARPIRKVYELAIVGIQVFMLVKTSQDQAPHLPLLGDLADRSVAEQK